MFYEPVQTQRFFERERRYSSINWPSLSDVVDAFDRRIRGWYTEAIDILLERGLIESVKLEVRRQTGRQDGAHYSFTVMAMTCMLIDTLSQYRYGQLKSAGPLFQQFVREQLPSYRGALLTPVWHYDHGNHQTGRELKQYAEVLWHGFRCGILHQAHAPLYCGIVPGTDPPSVEATNIAKYGAAASPARVGADCPVVVIRPEHLYAEVMTFFTGYLRDLKDKAPQHDQLRNDFKTKFADSFGVDLSASTL